MRTDLLNELHDRNFIKDIAPDRESFAEVLKSQQITLYNGFDLTAPSLHIGHLMPLMNLRKFLEYNHKVIILLGGGTTKIGDPSDKNELRKILTSEEINSNKEAILNNSIGKIIDLKNPNVIIVDNNQWLSELNYIDFLRDIGVHFTINKMISMDFVKRRIDNEIPLTFLEFNYMLIQAYDFFYLNKHYNCTLQIGGSDQWGNIVQGLDLLRRKNQNQQFFGVTLQLLLKSDGTKMGKTAGNAVWLNDQMLHPNDYYQYFRNVDDQDVIKLFKSFTDLSLSEIAAIESDLINDKANINDIKKKLAFEVTKICHGEDAANNATKNASILFQKDIDFLNNESINDICTKVEHNEKLTQLLMRLNFTTSHGEGKRLIKNNAVKINDIKIEDENFTLTQLNIEKLSISVDRPTMIIAGKKNRALIVFSSNDTNKSH